MTMNDLNHYEWGRWKFSLEAKQLFQKLNLGQDNKDTELPEAWRLLLSHVQDNKGSDQEGSNIDYFTDSSISTDVDEEEWEDLKAYTKDLNLLKEKYESNKTNISNFGEPCTSSQRVESSDHDCLSRSTLDHNHENTDDIEDCRMKIKKKIRKTQESDYNIFSQLLCSQSNAHSEDHLVENDIIYILKEAITKEEPDLAEIKTLLDSNSITKQDFSLLWTELSSSCTGRLLLCSILADYKSKSVFLCQTLLLPWLSDGNTANMKGIVQKISNIIPKFPDIGIKHLIVPLLDRTDENGNTFTNDLYLLQDLMAQLTSHHWMLLLNEIIDGGIKLRKCHLPLIKLIIESADETIVQEETNAYGRLLDLIDSVISDYSKDRDFGLLIITIVNCIRKTKNASPDIVKRLKNIQNNYEGSMRFKIANVIKQLNK